MSCCELELAFLIPTIKVKADAEETIEAPYLQYKGTEYKKTLRLKIPSWQPIKSKLKRFYNWLRFVWCHSRARKCRKITFLTLFVIFFLLFTVIFVLIPLSFKYSTSFQQHVVFRPIINTHESYNAVIEFRKSYDLTMYHKPKNMYVVVNKTFNITLGLWSLTPHKHEDQYTPTVNDPYLLYFHDFTGDRRTYTDVYNELLKNFHVIVFDYRSYADSSHGKLSETDLVNDCVQLYKWLKQNTNSSIYVWGNHLGAAVAAHTVVKLQKEQIEPVGLILENPYLSIGHYLEQNWFIANVVSYTFWYKQTITNPLHENDLSFSIINNILSINSPIMFVLYGNYRNPFDAYVNSGYISYSSFKGDEKHVRVQADVSYYFNYKGDVGSFSATISNFVRGCTKYREDQNKL
ncbi:hypothetical protein RN001_015323 [Aquatica leii]|uniref:Uncharacterized protein n=1 Tax=Aquatica leii TaxID=1421715 RepID=A0AAN7NZ19_9COLE|nr:hypothetical protein RN001_015323 [Aquatica leii]